MRITLPLLFMFAALGQASAAEPSTSRPNVIIILMDDMGARDADVLGNPKFHTPHLSRMAAQGMLFKQGYADGLSDSATRAAVLTGKHPARLHLTEFIPGHSRPYARLSAPDWTKRLELSETTIAETLRAAGYVTGIIGRWQLSPPTNGEAFDPEHQGFDVCTAVMNTGQPSYFSPYAIPGLKDGPDGEYLTDRLTTEAVSFITANKDKPFFLYLAHYAIHRPLKAKQADVERCLARGLLAKGPCSAAYVAMMESVDASLGRLLDTLDGLKLGERTLVVFTSDNGGIAAETENAPMRAGKGSPYEAAVRVPFLARWSGTIPAGVVSDVPVCTMDLYPTILDAAKLPDASGHRSDGVSILPLLTKTGALAPRPLFWHYPHYHPGGSTTFSAVRDGDFRLVEFFEDSHLELYNLRDDLGEERDLSKTMPDKTRELHAMLKAWRDSVGAQFPKPNPQYDPARDSEKGSGKK